MSRSVTVAFLLVVLVAQRAPRGAGLQDGQPVFRAGVELVTIDVVATGANGAPVHNLRAEDFEILEDGVPQRIQTFQFVDLSSTSAIRPLPPGIASNEVEPGGLFVVVLDELGLQVDDVSQARRVAERFFKETLLPNDYVAIIRSGTDSGFFLTSDRTLALSTIPLRVHRTCLHWCDWQPRVARREQQRDPGRRRRQLGRGRGDPVARRIGGDRRERPLQLQWPVRRHLSGLRRNASRFHALACESGRRRQRR